MDMHANHFQNPVSDFVTRPTLNPTHRECERLEWVTHLLSTLTMVARSLDMAHLYNSERADPLVACIVALSDRVLAEVRAWPTLDPGLHVAEYDRTVAQERVDGCKLLQSLTARELDMLKLIASGMSNKEIADQLHLTEGTVKGYVSRMLSKIQVADRTQAALFAACYGLAPPKSPDNGHQRVARAQRATAQADMAAIFSRVSELR